VRYGIAAEPAHPERPIVVFAGDGPMQMADLVTVARRWRERDLAEVT